MVKCSECIFFDHNFCYGEKDRQGYTLQKLIKNPNEQRICDKFMGWREFLRVLFLERHKDKRGRAKVEGGDV